MEETKYMNDFQIITLAGTSRSLSMKAIKEARKKNFDKAEELLAEAEVQMNEAHKMQFSMLQEEAQGNPVDINIVTVHGQDHMTMAVMTYDLAKEFIDIHKELNELKQQ